MQCLSQMTKGFLLEIQNLSLFYKRVDFSVVHSVSLDPPKFLPISSTPQPERRQPPQRRHSIEKETPTNVRQFLPASRQSSRSLVSNRQTLQSNLQAVRGSGIISFLEKLPQARLNFK